MIEKIGYCDNFGQCTGADTKQQIRIEGPNTVCPICGTELEGGKPPWTRIVVLGLALVVLLGGAIWAFKEIGRPAPPTNSDNVNINPVPAPEITPASLCSGELNNGVLEKIMNREQIIMGVEFDAMPLNSSPVYEDASDEEFEAYTPQKDASPQELARRKDELTRERTGFDYEVARLIADQIGLKGKNPVRTREVSSFGELFCLLNRKEPDGKFSVDMIMSGIVQDDKYSDTINWSKSYATFYYALITKKSSDIEDISDLKNKTIGIIQNDSAVEAYVTKELPDAKIVKYDDSEWGWTDCAINKHECAVDANKDLPKVDACIYDYPFAKEEMGKVTPAKGQSLEILDANLPNSIREYRIGVAKGNDELLEKINAAIKFIKEDPISKLRYQSLVLKYMTPPKGALKVPEFEEGSEMYIVQKGDTLSEIADRLLGDPKKWQELADKNNIANEYLIQPGQKIYIPGKVATMVNSNGNVNANANANLKNSNTNKTNKKENRVR